LVVPSRLKIVDLERIRMTRAKHKQRMVFRGDPVRRAESRGVSVTAIEAIDKALGQHSRHFGTRYSKDDATLAVHFAEKLLSYPIFPTVISSTCKHRRRLHQVLKVLQYEGLVICDDWDSWKKHEYQVPASRKFRATPYLMLLDWIEIERRCISYSDFRHRRYIKPHSMPSVPVIEYENPENSVQLGCDLTSAIQELPVGFKLGKTRAFDTVLDLVPSHEQWNKLAAAVSCLRSQPNENPHEAELFAPLYAVKPCGRLYAKQLHYQGIPKVIRKNALQTLDGGRSYYSVDFQAMEPSCVIAYLCRSNGVRINSAPDVYLEVLAECNKTDSSLDRDSVKLAINSGLNGKSMNFGNPEASKSDILIFQAFIRLLAMWSCSTVKEVKAKLKHWRKLGKDFWKIETAKIFFESMNTIFMDLKPDHLGILLHDEWILANGCESMATSAQRIFEETSEAMTDMRFTAEISHHQCRDDQSINRVLERTRRESLHCARKQLGFSALTSKVPQLI
jgi:hypothetical protein